MSMHDAVRRAISADFIGEIKASATDRHDQVRVALGVRGDVTAVTVLHLSSDIKSVSGFREAIFDAANRAETARVMNEVALAGDLSLSDPSSTVRPELPGPTASRLVVLSPDEQANQLQRYINQGGLEHVEAPRTRRETSTNGYLSLSFNARGQLASVDTDQQWLWSTTLDRINDALQEVVSS